jgi:hypothetical protein
VVGKAYHKEKNKDTTGAQLNEIFAGSR